MSTAELSACPKCKCNTLRMKVSLFVDIPTRLHAGLSKSALRSADVRLDGAGWDRALFYCARCGFNSRSDPRLTEGSR